MITWLRPHETIRRPSLQHFLLVLNVIGCVLFIIFVLHTSEISSKWLFVVERVTPKGNESIIPSGELHNKWIVITTVLHPSQDVANLAAIEGWHLLVVGDVDTPTNWSFPGVEYLGVDKQRALPYGIVFNKNHAPYNSYSSRKNIGYLYAIEHGAEYIYDTDDNNHPTSAATNNFHLNSSTTTGLILDRTMNVSDDVINPYSHFGQPTIWPRGYPLDAIKNNDRTATIEKNASRRYTVCRFKTPTIQHSLMDGHPDVDAIFRLTRPTEVKNIRFDARAPPFALPVGVFAPFNSRNTLFTYEALWALLLPTSVSSLVTDIWRGYWAQRLMWLLGHNNMLAFYPPTIKLKQRKYSSKIDVDDDDVMNDDERDLYLRSGLLIAFLKEWQCSSWQSSSFFDCVRQLSRDMAHNKFWSDADAQLIDDWLSHLKSIGYREPTMNKFKIQNSKVQHSKFDKSTSESNSTFENWNAAECDDAAAAADGHHQPRTVYFSPVIRTSMSSSSSSDRRFELMERTQALIRFCGAFQNETILKKLKSTKFAHENLLLIIVFNMAFHRVIPLLDNVYYEHFPNILYCGDMPETSYEEFVEQMRSPRPADDNAAHHEGGGGGDWIERPVSFLKINTTKGFFGYECAIRAMEMNYDVDGYVVVGDDVLFNFWNLGQVDLSRAAYESKPTYRNRYIKPKDIPWQWWGTAMGFNATNRALDELHLTSSKDPSRFLVKKYVDNMNVKNLRKMFAYGGSDIYYLSGSDKQLFLRIAKVFLKNRVFLEIAVPMLIEGMSKAPTGSLTGKSIWGNDRKKWKTFYNSSDIYLHPAKLSKVLFNRNAKISYCSYYVQAYLKKLNLEETSFELH